MNGFITVMHSARQALLPLSALCLVLTCVAGCAKPTPTQTSAAEVTDLDDLEERTLNSMEKVDDYPLYVMHYYGHYSTGAKEQTAQGGQNRPLVVRDGTPDWACSLFAALGDETNALYGRNFDWDHSPAVLLFTHPDTHTTTDKPAYASVTMVNIAYLGFSDDTAGELLDMSLDERRALLMTAFFPFDGVNERGLVVGMAAVPDAELPRDPDKDWMGSLVVIRVMLDYAQNVDEAVAILQSYNIEMEGGPTIHYLLADVTGKAVLVEFSEGEVILFPNTTAWHEATNFLRAGVTDPQGQCNRYDALSARLTETGGKLTTAEALDLLKSVAQSGTQWSVVYGIHSGEIDVVMGRDYQNIHHFDLTP